MKRVGYLYDKMLDKTLIRNSIQKALKHKKKTETIKNILNNIDYYTDYFYNKLKDDAYEFKVGHKKVIQNGSKLREIQVPTLSDHIVQHIIISVLSPIIMKSMYKFNCGVVPKRGPIYAEKYVEKTLKRYKPKYALKMDIKKYFHNIDTSILLKQLRSRIKDERFLTLIAKLLNTANEGTSKGIPIGFYSSQWLANFYLEDLDYFIKQELKASWYVRYVDDLVILGDNKRTLQRIKSKIITFIKEKLNLDIKNNYQVFPIAKRHIDFVGYMYSYKYIKLRKSTFKTFKRRHKQLLEDKNIYLCRSYTSLRGWLTHIKRGIHLIHTTLHNIVYTKATQYIAKRDKELNYNYAIC